MMWNRYEYSWKNVNPKIERKKKKKTEFVNDRGGYDKVRLLLIYEISKNKKTKL